MIQTCSNDARQNFKVYLKEDNQNKIWEFILHAVDVVVRQMKISDDYMIVDEIKAMITEKILLKFDKIKTADSPKAYLEMIIRNTAKNIIRNEDRRVKRHNKAIETYNYHLYYN